MEPCSVLVYRARFFPVYFININTLQTKCLVSDLFPWIIRKEKGGMWLEEEKEGFYAVYNCEKRVIG